MFSVSFSWSERRIGAGISAGIDGGLSGIGLLVKEPIERHIKPISSPKFFL
jgi:hypothetical protein